MLIRFGQKYFRVAGDGDVIRGTESKDSASVFWLGKTAGGFTIKLDGEDKHVCLAPDKERGRDSILLGDDPVTLTLDGDGTIEKWRKNGYHVKTPDGSFLGYNERHNMIERFASKTDPPFLLEKMKMGAGDKVLRQPVTPEPEY